MSLPCINREPQSVHNVPQQQHLLMDMSSKYQNGIDDRLTVGCYKLQANAALRHVMYVCVCCVCMLCVYVCIYVCMYACVYEWCTRMQCVLMVHYGKVKVGPGSELSYPFNAISSYSIRVSKSATPDARRLPLGLGNGRLLSLLLMVLGCVSTGY